MVKVLSQAFETCSFFAKGERPVVKWEWEVMVEISVAWEKLWWERVDVPLFWEKQVL